MSSATAPAIRVRPSSPTEVGTVTARPAPAPHLVEVRCPRCAHKVADALTGTLTITCRHCKQTVTIAA